MVDSFPKPCLFGLVLSVSVLQEHEQATLVHEYQRPVVKTIPETAFCFLRQVLGHESQFLCQVLGHESQFLCQVLGHEFQFLRQVQFWQYRRYFLFYCLFLVLIGKCIFKFDILFGCIDKKSNHARIKLNLT